MAPAWMKRPHLRNAVHEGAPLGGPAGNCAEVLPEMVRRGIVPDLLTDQTSAHDPLNGTFPRASLWESRGAARLGAG